MTLKVKVFLPLRRASSYKDTTAEGTQHLEQLSFPGSLPKVYLYKPETCEEPAALWAFLSTSTYFSAHHSCWRKNCGQHPW